MDVIRTLVLEGNDGAFQHIRDALAGIPATRFVVERAAGTQAERRLVDLEHDLYLIGHGVGTAVSLLQRALAAGCRAPLIVLSEDPDRDYEMRVVDSGAADCLARSELTPALLERSIRYSFERRRTEDQLVRLASCDQLTGVANRSLFQERLSDELERARRSQESAALLQVDIDRFRKFNDTFGHGAGDAVLKETARVLSEAMGPGVAIGRLGSDEFVVLLRGADAAKEAVAAGQRVLEAVRGLRLESAPVPISCSIGITVFPSDGTTVEELLRNADAALAAAKARGRDTYQCFEAELSQQHLLRIALETRLRAAVDEGRLELHYQPQIEFSTGRVIGLEALLRWQDPERGTVSPAQFVPILEETGLIVRVGEWVIHEACRQQRRWAAAGMGELRVAVNVSPLQFRRDLYGAVTRALAETGVDPGMLELEITEGILIDDLDAVSETLRALKSLGVRIAIDDFGTGYSSLAYLRRLPIDLVKVDRSFVRDVERDPDAAAIVAAIVALTHKLGREVIAEGVETEAQRRFLADQGCELGQGYLFSPPLPAVWQGSGAGTGSARAGGTTC